MSVKEGKVYSYKEGKALKQKYPNASLHLDHIPSKQAIKQAYAELTRKKDVTELNKEIRKTIEDESNTLARNIESHKLNDTTGSRNKKISLVDSRVLALATIRDLEKYKKIELERGVLSKKEIEQAIENVNKKNIQIGLYSKKELDIAKEFSTELKQIDIKENKEHLSKFEEIANRYDEKLTKNSIQKKFDGSYFENKYRVKGKNLPSLLGWGLVGASMIPQDTEASPLIKPNISNSIASKYNQLSNYEQYGANIQGATNTLNAIQAGIEFKDGAKASPKEFLKGKNYQKGLKEAVSGYSDLKNPIKGAKNITKQGVISGGKTVGKSILKKLPLIGLLAGIGFGAKRAWEGDWTGAGMELASGASSLIPGIGTAASTAIDIALLEKDTGILAHGLDTLSSEEENKQNIPLEPKYIFPKENSETERLESKKNILKSKTLPEKNKTIKKVESKHNLPTINLKLNSDIMVDNPESLDIERKIAKSKQLNRIVSNISSEFTRRGFRNATFSSNISINNVLILSFSTPNGNFFSSIRYEGDIREEDVYKWANEQMNKIESLSKSKNTLYKLNPNRLSQNIKNKRFIKSSISSNTININLENKSQKLFKKLGLRHEKIPTLNHNQNLPEKIEGMYKKDDLTLKKNPRISDKKAEAVAMHEIYHHTQKDKGLELGQEEAQANMLEKAYLNENQETSQEIDFDLIYAYTIKQFYEHEELEQLVRVLGGDASCARRVYSSAIEVISEYRAKEVSNNVGYENSQVKKVVGDSGVRYKDNTYKAKFSDNVGDIVRNKDLKDVADGISSVKDYFLDTEEYDEISESTEQCVKNAELEHADDYSKLLPKLKECTAKSQQAVLNKQYDDFVPSIFGYELESLKRPKSSDVNLTVEPYVVPDKNSTDNPMEVSNSNASIDTCTSYDEKVEKDNNLTGEVVAHYEDQWATCMEDNSVNPNPNYHTPYERDNTSYVARDSVVGNHLIIGENENGVRSMDSNVTISSDKNLTEEEQIQKDAEAYDMGEKGE